MVRPSGSEAKSRKLRHRDIRRKLSSILLEALSPLNDVAVIGSDPMVSHIAATYGIEPGALAHCQAMLDGQPITLVGVPSRLWYRPRSMQALQKLKASMERCGRSCVLLPQQAISALESPDARERRVKMLIELIRDPIKMGIDQSCCSRRGGDPIGCRAMQLLTGNGCAP